MDYLIVEYYERDGLGQPPQIKNLFVVNEKEV